MQLGGDKKNNFFAAINIQNITKPHVTNVFCVPEEAVEKYYPDVWKALNESGTREECITPLSFIDTTKIVNLCKENDVTDIDVNNIVGNRLSYRIYKWVFSDKPWLIPNVDEFVAEGFIQDNNIRSVFLPDDDNYWVSCVDVNSEVEIETGEKVPISFFNSSENRQKYKIKSLNQYNNVLRYIDQGIQSKCILETELGNKLNCTKDHRFYTLNEEGELILKTFTELTTDDYIISIDEGEL